MKRLFTSSSSLLSCVIALVMMSFSQSVWAEYVKLTALSGSKDLKNGEGCAKLVDTKVGTKWGQSFDPANVDDPGRTYAWVVVKAEKAVVPDWYFLVTGNDTGGSPGRNWSSWNIYGGNFATDEEAVRGDIENPAAGGWTLIDQREAEPLPQADSTPWDTHFNNADGKTAYQYFWIEVLESVQGTDVYLQMDEWGLGTYGDLEKYLEDLANQVTGTDEPIQYTIIDGDRNNGDSEGLSVLFDNDINTKWGNGFSPKSYGQTSGGAFFIVKTSREIAPEYYKLVTGTDNESWNDRNWGTWQIYAMAEADVTAGKPTRASDKWVLLDRKDKVGYDQLPDLNKFTVMFGLSEENTTPYRYFKVEIDETQGAGYMQMGEFALGDGYTFVLDKQAVVNNIEATFDPNLFAEKALLDNLVEIYESIKASTDAITLNNLNLQYKELNQKVTLSASNYAELITVRNQGLSLINEDNLTEAAMAYAKAWTSETDAIAPGEGYPVGNFAYIKANRHITGEQALAEAKRVNEYFMANTKTVDDPIYAAYETIIDGPGFSDTEMGHALIDGDPQTTKWCAHTDHGDWTLVFKSDSPIKPTYYGLVTGGDTYSYPSRNWKTWKIWGANFAEGETITKESDKWVLLDSKSNVGTDILATYNVYESYINLSEGCAEPYEYFMIHVYEAGGGTMQMNEFTFYNMGNLFEYREEFISQFADFAYALEGITAYAGYVNEFNEKFEQLQNSVNAPDVRRLANELNELMAIIEESAALYETYMDLAGQLDGLSIESENMSQWRDDYLSDNEGAGVKYIRGSYEYITSTLSLDNEVMQDEITYIQWIIDVVEGIKPYILIGGHTRGEWGDGFYGNIIDGIALNSTEIDPETGEEVKVNATKWGGQPDINGNTYVIFRTMDPVNPFFYTLTTGNDTGAYQDRNWGTWYIYGANFTGDGEATKDAEGWELIDVKENIGKDRLRPVDAEPSYFGFSTETTVEYTYYKVVVTKAYAGDAIQMNELRFGTEEEFEVIKEEYIAAANEFDYDVTAEQKLIDEYEATITEIDECVNMEALFRCNYRLAELRDLITASAETYDMYISKVEEANAYLNDNPLAESEALTIFDNYLNETIEVSELYPNGSAQYIIENHLLADSVVIDEIKFMESLKAAAVAAGYGKGMEISSLIVNRSFGEATETLKDEEGNSLGRQAEGWEGYIFRSATNEEMTMSAAEFCNENSKFDVKQTLANLKNGYYKVTLNAGFRANGDLLSYNYAAMAYANDVATYIPVIREDAVADSADAWLGTYPDKMIYDADSIENFGIGIWGCEGSAHAFLNDRYLVTLVAQVVDGTLTIGLKNEGTTKGGDWTGAGNFRLFYLGEEAADATEALTEVAEYNAARITTLTETYMAADPADSETFVSEPNYSVSQKEQLLQYSGVNTYEAEKALGELMQSINETKKAYVELNNASDKVYNHWISFLPLEDTSMEEDVYAVKDNLAEGSYEDGVAAEEAKDALYTKWPDYLGVKNDKGTNVEYFQERYAFEITTIGSNPALELTGLYEALEEDEVILTFDYTAAQDIEGSTMMYETPNLLTGIVEKFDTLPATEEWTAVYVNVNKGIKNYQFGTAANHSIYWTISSKANKENTLSLSARNFRFITKAEMKAAGGKAINGVEGDINGDDAIDIADAVSVLNIMAEGAANADADINGDGTIDIADFVTILNMMAEQ
ncbi:MAG: dockerin type I repeat-containing protein [Bacteroidaceae bacterium]|nr:dockerin type I repeat-containing protein [Bacteroidaceae bacterium]